MEVLDEIALERMMARLSTRRYRSGLELVDAEVEANARSTSRSAVREVFDRPLIQRCRLHKIRNIENHLPDALASTVAKEMRAGYHDQNPLTAEATLEALAKSLEKTHPGAAGSLREGLAETLTIIRLGVPQRSGGHCGRPTRSSR